MAKVAVGQMEGNLRMSSSAVPYSDVNAAAIFLFLNSHWSATVSVSTEENEDAYCIFHRERCICPRKRTGMQPGNKMSKCVVLLYLIKIVSSVLNTD